MSLENFKIRKYHFGDILVIEMRDGEVFVGKYIQDNPDYKDTVNVLILYSNLKPDHLSYKSKGVGSIAYFHEDYVKTTIYNGKH